MTRTDGLVPEVRIRYRPLAAESHGAHDWMRLVQPRLLLAVPGTSANGGQHHGQVHHHRVAGSPLRSVRSRYAVI